MEPTLKLRKRKKIETITVLNENTDEQSFDLSVPKHIKNQKSLEKETDQSDLDKVI